MSHFGRATIAALFASLIAVEASAATLVRPSAATSASERGVTIIRGAKPAWLTERTATPAPRAACAKVRVSVSTVWPARQFRQQGFWSGDGLKTASMRAASRRPAHGFYADRIAAGL